MNSKQAKRLRRFVYTAHPTLTGQSARDKYNDLKKLYFRAVRSAGYEIAAQRLRTMNWLL